MKRRKPRGLSKTSIKQMRLALKQRKRPCSKPRSAINNPERQMSTLKTHSMDLSKGWRTWTSMKSPAR
jgi:hypothetical protein